MIHFEELPVLWRAMLDRPAWFHVYQRDVVDPCTDWGDWPTVDEETDWQQTLLVAESFLRDSEVRRNTLLSRMPSAHAKRWRDAPDVALEVGREVLFVIVRRIREMSHDEWEEWFMEFLKRS